MSEPKVSNQQLQAYLQDRMEGVTYSWEWPKLQDAMHDLLDIRRRIAELERILTTLRTDLGNEADYCTDDGPNEAMRWLARLEQIEQEKGGKGCG